MFVLTDGLGAIDAVSCVPCVDGSASICGGRSEQHPVVFSGYRYIGLVGLLHFVIFVVRSGGRQIL